MSIPMQTVQLDIQKPTMFRAWCVVLASALFFFYAFIQMNLFNAINSALVKEFHFSAQQISQFIAFASYGNIIFLFPAGILLDRFSVRILLFLAFAVSIISSYIFCIFDNFWIMNASRLTLGMAGSFALLSAIKLASRWFEPRHMALVIGVVVTMAMLGGTVAQTPLALLTETFGWRIAMQFVVALGAALIIIQLMIVRDEPKGLEKVDLEEHSKLQQIGFWRSLGITIANSQNWLSGIYISLVNLPLFVFGGIWGVPYLTQVHHFNQVQATEITSMIFIGMMIGSPLAGLISDGMGQRKLPMIVGAILSILVMLVIMYAPTMPLLAEICLYFALGFIISCQVIGYPVIAESNLHTVTATATSLASILIMAGGTLVPLFGWLLELSKDATIVDNVAIYSLADFTRANWMMLGGLIIALVVSLLIKETYCKQLSQNN